MTGLAEFLDDFDAPKPAEPIEPGVDPKLAESQRLEAFEEGYRAGWDDSVKAQQADSSQISSTLSQRLADLSFTYHEAHTAMTKSMMPLLEELVTAVLPKLARDHIGGHVAEQIQSLASEIGNTPVEVAVAPANRAAVEEVMDGDHGFPVSVIEDETLSDDQADIRFGQSERQIDLGDLVEQVRGAVDGLAVEPRRRTANG